MQFLSQLKIKLFANFVGTDEFGNSYYEDKNKKRYVVYKGIAEPSKVPAKWFGWLHHTNDVSPVNINTKEYSWQKIHLPNLTGTKYAFNPKNSQSTTSSKVRKTYEEWKP